MQKVNVTEYNQVLPFDPNKKVLDQFGWNPVSVIKPTKSSKKNWSRAYLDNVEYRRNDGIEYLAGLKFSEFHAGLAENIIHYWSMKGATVVDPFAGRLTRAYVTSSLGRKYIGYDVVERTVNETNAVLQEDGLDGRVYLGNGCTMDSTSDGSADLVFTCPPYHQLEKYESVDYQLSDIGSYDDFLTQINVCAENCHRVLKDGGFCIWVVGDWREQGTYRSFHSDLIKIMTDQSLSLHDTIIMENQSPFATLQLGKVAANRYTSKIHEFILVFKKGGVLKPVSNVIMDIINLEDFYGTV